MKNKKYHTVKTFPKSNIKIVEVEAKSIPVTHKYKPEIVKLVFAAELRSKSEGSGLLRIKIKWRDVSTRAFKIVLMRILI